MIKPIRILALGAVLGAAILSLAGCGGKSASAVQTVKVGVPNAVYPFGYTKGGKLDGYDVAVLKAVDKQLKGYKFSYEAADFATTLSNLGSKKVSLAAFEFELNAEREKKFVYGTVGYAIWDTYIVTAKNKPTMDSFAQLKGKKLENGLSTNQAALAEAFLKKHPGYFTDQMGTYTDAQFVQNLSSGSVDAALAPKYEVDGWNRKLKQGLQIGAKPINHSDAYLLFGKTTDKKLVTAVNKAMKTLKKNGTLKQLSQKYLKGDYVPKA